MPKSIRRDSCWDAALLEIVDRDTDEDFIPRKFPRPFTLNDVPDDHFSPRKESAMRFSSSDSAIKELSDEIDEFLETPRMLAYNEDEDDDDEDFDDDDDDEGEFFDDVDDDDDEFTVDDDEDFEDGDDDDDDEDFEDVFWD